MIFEIYFQNHSIGYSLDAAYYCCPGSLVPPFFFTFITPPKNPHVIRGLMSQPLTYSPQIGFASPLQEQKRFFFSLHFVPVLRPRRHSRHSWSALRMLVSCVCFSFFGLLQFCFTGPHYSATLPLLMGFIFSLKFNEIALRKQISPLFVHALYSVLVGYTAAHSGDG